MGPASLKRWVWQWRATGSVEPKKRAGGRPRKVDAACDVVLRELVAEQPDAYCWELAERLHARTGVQVDEDTIGRALRRLGITRKKKTLKASEPQRPDVIEKREAFTATAAVIDPSRAHFVDEAGTHTAMTRDYARAGRGARVVEHVPRNRGTVTTMIASLCLAGVEAICTFVGGTTGERFYA